MRVKVTSIGYGGNLEYFLSGLDGKTLIGEHQILNVIDIANKFMNFRYIGFMDDEVIIINKNDDYLVFAVDDNLEEDFISMIIKNFNVSRRKF